VVKRIREAILDEVCKTGDRFGGRTGVEIRSRWIVRRAKRLLPWENKAGFTHANTLAKANNAHQQRQGPP
jgi:hypothetical protein